MSEGEKLIKVACVDSMCNMEFWVREGDEPRYCPFCGIIINLSIKKIM